MRYSIRQAKPSDFPRVYYLLSKNKLRLGPWWTCKGVVRKWLNKGCVYVLTVKEKIVALRVQNNRRLYATLSEFPGGGVAIVSAAPKGTYSVVSCRHSQAKSMYLKAGYVVIGKFLFSVRKKPKWFYIMLKEV